MNSRTDKVHMFTEAGPPAELRHIISICTDTYI